MTFIEGLALFLSVDDKEVFDRILAILAGLAAVGLVAMAAVEVVKALFARAIFNFVIFRRFVPDAILRQRIFQMAVGGQRVAFYTLKANALVERLSEVTQGALTYSTKRSVSVVRALALAQATGVDQDLMDQVDDDLYAMIKEPDLRDMESMNRRDQARERLHQLISSNLEGLEIRLTHYWELLLHLFAVLLSVGLIYWLIISNHEELQTSVGAWIFAIVAGMVAPVAHDILTTLGGKKANL